MSQAIIDKIRAARAVRITAGSVVFFATRPTVSRFGEMHRSVAKDADICRECVTGWDNVRERDIIDGGGDDIVAWDAALFGELIVDRVDWSAAIVAAIVAATLAQMTAQAEQQKN
jgi:hypothetical protein